MLKTLHYCHLEISRLMTIWKLEKTHRGKIRRSGFWAAILALPLATAAAPAQGPLKATAQSLTAAQETAEYTAIEDYLEGIKTLSADFIQEGPDGTMAEGSMHLKRPGKLRFDYGKDSPLLLVSDGSILTFVDNDVKQVTRWPINDTPLGILVAKKVDLKKDVNVTSMTRGGGLLKVTVKDPKHAEQGYITLIFNAAPLELRAWEVTDSQGLKTRVTLMNPEKNVAVNDRLFTFKDPRVLPLTGNRRH